MTELSFGLRERPFPAAPLVAAYYPAESLESSRVQLQRCVERAEGAGVVIGGAGMGKSLLLHVLAGQFRDRFHVAHLAGAAICTRRALLQNILFELGLPYRGLQEGELRLSLIDHLQPSRQCPHGMLLLIDEAHTLPLRLLEEIRLLTNLVREGSPRVRLVLAGSRALEERLANPKLDSFQQRIAVRAYLQPWSSRETAGYVGQELARCGALDSLFAADALSAVHIAAAGIPRLINQICDHALTSAVADESVSINAASIQQAWADLQQLPAPWHEPAAPSSSSIEFGVLDEPVEDRTFASTSAVLESAEESGTAHQILLPDGLSSIELTAVPSARELFGDGFSEEEIVIDRYAALDIQALGDRPQVITPLGQAFAREVAAVEEEVETRPALKIVAAGEEAAAHGKTARTGVGPLAKQVALARSRAAAEAADGPTVTLAFDPVFPEEDVVEEPNARIVAIDQGQSSPPAAHARSPVAGRFRNLFANLRGKKS